MLNISTQTCAILLEQCSSIIKNFENNDILTGRKYNIFKVANINEKEVIMCRVLADLLDPKGKHYRGDTYLKYFIEIVNEKLKTPFILNTKNARVYTEYRTDIKRRIDIVIEDEKIFIPIEVKIYAKDQENQVSDYAQFSRLKTGNRNIQVLYLTIDGTAPDNANKNEYIKISFKNEILMWLNKCLKNSDTENIIPIREILRQLIDAVKSICGKSEDEKMEKAIEQLVFQSEDSVKTAIAVKKALGSLEDYAYKYFYEKVFPQIKEHIPNADWDDEDKKWSGCVYFPIKNNDYMFGVNFDWQMGIWRENSNESNLKEKMKIRKMLTELTGSENEWGDEEIWGVVENIQYLDCVNIDSELYFYRLSKQYLENTTDVVNRIVNIANELNNV